MRLELGSFPVVDVSFGSRTRWSHRKLEIDKQELLDAVGRDPRIISADLAIAAPGESVRITTVRDVIEPRVKVRGDGMVYPGICGRPVSLVGQGRTHRLSGVGVVEVADVFIHEGTDDAWVDFFIDMSGPGAELTPYGSLFNICLTLEVDTRLNIEHQNDALHSAALVVSDHLAATVADMEPESLEVFELAEVDASLPRVVLIHNLHSPQHYTNSLTAFGTAFYGVTRLTLPFIVHPNEFLDGAISFGEYPSKWDTSWTLVNNPLVRELYKRHGVEANFVGCIITRTRWSSQVEKDITSLQAAKTAQLLGAKGAIITYDSGGNDFMEVIRTVQACERLGIKTVLITPESDPRGGGSAILEPLPEARAIVSTGFGRTSLDAPPLPPVAKVIGAAQLVENTNARRGTISAYGSLPGVRGQDHYGFGRLSCFEY